MKTIYAVYTEKLPQPRDPEGDAVGLNRTFVSHESDLLTTVRGLRRLTSLPSEVLERVAYEIVGEDVAETETREALAARYAQTSLELGGATLQLLDGGYHQMWKRTRES